MKHSKISFLSLLLGLLLFLAPLFPDVQIARPKLLVLEIGTFILLLFFVVKSVFSENIKFKKTNFNLPVIAYFSYLTFAYIFSPTKYVALSEFKRMLLCILIYFISANSGGLTTVLSGFILGSTLATLYGLLQHWGNFTFFNLVINVPKLDRVFSTFGNPIFFGAHLVIFLPVLLGLLVYFYSWGKNFLGLLFGIIFILGTIALYFTKTRASWIAFAFSLLLFGILNLKSKKVKMIFVGLTAIFCSVFIVMTKNVWLRHQAHPLIWRDTLKMWLDSPFFGTGPGTFHINFPKFASEDLLKIWPQKQQIINDAHNEYIQILAELGIVGFGIFFWLIFNFFSFCVKIFKKYSDTKEIFILTGLVSAVSGILIQNIFSVDMRFIISAFYLFLLIGLVYSFEENEICIKLGISKPAKILLTLTILFLFGIFGFDKKSNIYLFSLVNFNLKSMQIKIEPSCDGTGLLPQILKPYIAQKKLSKEPDFFDERVLEPYKTISELEKLVNMPEKEFMKKMGVSKEKLPVAIAKIYEKIAWVYAKEKNFVKAIENYEKSIVLNPGEPGPYNNLGNIYFLMNNRKKAIEYYKKSIEISPGQIDAHTNLGIAYYYEGLLKEAAEQFNLVLNLDPKNEKAIVMLKKMRE